MQDCQDDMKAAGEQYMKILEKGEKEGVKKGTQEMVDTLFGEEMAKKYDEMPVNRDFHPAFLSATSLILTHLPPKSRVLCIGVGTGTEIVKLGEAFPEWTFLGLDPSQPMLDRARAKLEAAGLADRAELRSGTLDDLPGGEGGFDLATTFFVSHFVADRLAFFRSARDRLRPGGYLVTGDVVEAEPGAGPMTPILFPAGWKGALGKGGFLFPNEEAVLDMLRSAGFGEPTQYFQWLYTRAHIAQRED